MEMGDGTLWKDIEKGYGYGILMPYSWDIDMAGYGN